MVLLVGSVLLLVFRHLSRQAPPEPASGPAADEDGERDAEALADDGDDEADDEAAVRPRHYGFAHVSLRRTLHERSEEWRTCRVAKSDAEVDQLVARWWDTLESSPAEEYPCKPTGKRIDSGIVVLMPPPRAVSEAYAVAVVEHASQVRYFVLERSFAGAMICEWVEAEHINRGSCRVSEKAFLSAVRRALEQSR